MSNANHTDREAFRADEQAAQGLPVRDARQAR